ncbi:hypothetical protein H5M12_004107 [Salmonella enterica]|nr:hypothetical protein [Salmonella enterica]
MTQYRAVLSAAVFPAPAGINRALAIPKRGMESVPRASGDKPARGFTVLAKRQCSPRQRG